MDQRTCRHIDDLRSFLDEEERTLAFHRAKKALEEDPEASALYAEAEQARNHYLTLRLERGEEDEKTIEALQAFHQKKLALDEHPSAQDYRHASAALSTLYRQIDDVLFRPFKTAKKCEGNR